MNRRHDSYEDYCKEIDEDAELKAHLADECDENVCPYCADERNDAELEEQDGDLDDIDELVEHVNNELDKSKCADFKQGDKVLYIPNHAHGDMDHKDVEHGIVSSINDKFVFVKYFPALDRFGWDGCTSQATDPTNLLKKK